MEIGNYYNDIICESFYDKNTYKIRIRTIPCEVFPSSLMVESLKMFRERYPVGTKFNTTRVKICIKPGNPGLELYHNVREYVDFYNSIRRHTEIGKVPPDEIYFKKQMVG